VGMAPAASARKRLQTTRQLSMPRRAPPRGARQAAEAEKARQKAAQEVSRRTQYVKPVSRETGARGRGLGGRGDGSPCSE
jgi:hypothetical protein